MPMFWNKLFVVLSLFRGCYLIDNKQARCFSFEFRLFDLSPRKSKRRNSNEKHVPCLFVINQQPLKSNTELFIFV